MSFHYQRICRFKLDIFPFQETEHPGFFDTEVDRTGNPTTNIWKILQFSRTYVSDFTAHISSKYINKSLFTDERPRKTTSVANSIPSKCLKFAVRC